MRYLRGGGGVEIFTTGGKMGVMWGGGGGGLSGLSPSPSAAPGAEPLRAQFWWRGVEDGGGWGGGVRVCVLVGGGEKCAASTVFIRVR